MKFRLTLGALVLVSLVPSLAVAQTARQYFEQLLSTHTLNRYADEYVCFPDKQFDDSQFAIIARTTDMRRAMVKNGQLKLAQKIGRHDLLFVTAYYKGVKTGRTVYLKSSTTSDETWNNEFSTKVKGKATHFKETYMINWASGRYRFMIYAVDYSNTTPAAEVDGVCKLIHPSAQEGRN